jgi:uncharacterized MnhB-related membrane protein
MVLQGILMVVVLMVTFQMMLFVASPAPLLGAAYADGWRKTGKVVVRLFQIQDGPDQGIAVAAFGTIGVYVVFAAALGVAARFAH